MRISNKKLFIDLKYFFSECHSLAVDPPPVGAGGFQDAGLNYEEMVDEFWKTEINAAWLFRRR
jgi:hypothetical protein